MGEVINFKVLAKSDNTNSLNIYFNITTISDSLKDASFKYVLLSSTDNKNFTEELKGNFLNISNGDSLTLVEDKVITTNTNYKLIIYIDGNMENPIDMRSSSLSGNIEMCAENADFVLNSFKVNGTEVTTFPLASAYTIDTTCSDADISFDYKSQSYIVSNINKDSKAKCGINYTTNSSLTNLNSHIISLAGTINDNGGVVNENGYRYEGKNPNNYIYFNNELWRIIGVFDSASHGVENSNLTKIIRNESIGGLVWNKSSSNNWASSSLYNLLNNNYYNKTDGTSSGNCYQHSTTVGGNCDYSYIGLSSEYRNMVQSVTWYLGGTSSYSNTAATFYTSERDSSAIKSGNSGAVTNYIGLMYASDYGYSPLSSNCARTTNLGSYNTSSCAGSSWLKKETYE